MVDLFVRNYLKVRHFLARMMEKESKKEIAIKLFQNEEIRVEWDNEKWYFSIIDVIAILTKSENPRKYWSVLKTRLKQEGSQLATDCSQLKMKSSDGKYYKTDVADTEQLLDGTFTLLSSLFTTFIVCIK